MKEILVKTLMSEDLTCLPPEAPLQLAVKKMAEQRYSCIIISEHEAPIGIVTERDLVKALNQDMQEIDLSLPVSNFMSSPILSLNENQSLFEAIVISRAERIRHLPVVSDDENLVGLVTQSDLANAHFRVTEIQSEMIKQSVAAKTNKLQQLNNDLQALSMEDHLMKIGNRRAMEVDLDHIHNASVRYGHFYSVLLMDIDFFKLYNDHYGHQAGDDALQSVASILKANIRGADRLYRYGGEELLLVLPHTNSAEAYAIARKLVSAIAKGGIPHEKSSYEVLTISCGGASTLNNGSTISTWETLVEQADRNLYQAKDGGRNRSIVAMES
jgi:diguanylate cyclase (GGDEF)-like protein